MMLLVLNPPMTMPAFFVSVFVLLNVPQTIEESILVDLKENFPYLFWLVAIAAFVGLACYKIAKFHSRFEKTEKDCIVNTNKFSIIDKKLGVIITHLVGQGLKADLFGINSPVELNELGHKILNDIGGKKYVDENKDELIKILNGKALNSGLDVQNCAIILISERTQESDFTNIKNYIFQNPRYKISDEKAIDLNLNTAVQIIGVYLRDKYFEKYPGLKDNHSG